MDFDLEQTDHLLTTTRAVRKRLDLTRPVPRELILDCVRISTQGPAGGNHQRWRWLMVDDPDLKAIIADSYRRSYAPYIASQQEAVAHRGERVGEERHHRVEPAPRRRAPGRPGAGDPVCARCASERLRHRCGAGLVGIDHPDRVELLPGRPVARARHRLDDPPSRRRRRRGRCARHSRQRDAARLHPEPRSTRATTSSRPAADPPKRSPTGTAGRRPARASELNQRYVNSSSRCCRPRRMKLLP